MTLRNRVTPDGRIIVDPARGLMMGNRGVLHDAAGRLGKARWRHKNWVACRLAFNGRHRRVMTPDRYTELFFLDEAVALAAGHRPCAECRNADYRRFKALWLETREMETHASGPLFAADLDRVLHAERAWPRRFTQRRHAAELADIPDGAFIVFEDDPDTALLVLEEGLLPYAPNGYGPARPKPRRARVQALTPPATMAVLEAGYRPALHPSAGGA